MSSRFNFFRVFLQKSCRKTSRRFSIQLQTWQSASVQTHGHRRNEAVHFTGSTPALGYGRLAPCQPPLANSFNQSIQTSNVFREGAEHCTRGACGPHTLCIVPARVLQRFQPDEIRPTPSAELPLTASRRKEALHPIAPCCTYGFSAPKLHPPSLESPAPCPPRDCASACGTHNMLTVSQNSAKVWVKLSFTEVRNGCTVLACFRAPRKLHCDVCKNCGTVPYYRM